MSRGTAHRTFRCDDETWAAAKARANAEDTRLSEVLRAALRFYAESWHPKRGDFVTAAGLQHIANCPQCRGLGG